MGLNEGGGGHTFLRVAYGAIRKTCQQGDTKAVSRELKDKTIIWERVWRSITGKFVGLTVQEHPEYGKSYIVHLHDGETFPVQVQEDSKYGGELLKRIPNLKIGTTYTLHPYDFTPAGESKRRVGLAVTDEDSGERVESYYQTFEWTGKDCTVTNKNGYPTFDGDSEDKEDWIIYFIRATKVMRAEAMKHLHEPEAGITGAVEVTQATPNADLPF